jgi:N-acetylmuramoyl-L-alanine amidase
MKLIEAPSPNFDARTAPPDMIILHYTGMQTGDAALQRMCDPDVEVSAHYMVEEDGRVFRLVPEERRAWHAGISYWRGRRNLNANSIGIEIVNPGRDWGYQPYPKAQVDAVIALLGDIRERWIIRDRDIVGHSDIAPDRKEDPGELFPWRRLAEHGHGLWVDVKAAPGAPLAEGAAGPEVFALQAGLTRLGYDCAPSGEYEPRTSCIVRAFQRHWRPRLVDGVADGETRARLIALLKLAAV